MPKGPVETPITDQEIAFAHLLLAGTITDRKAAEAVGINPGRAAYVKAKPRVKAYMEEHRASVRAGLVQHEVEALAKFNISREQILAKWWEFANIDPELTGYNTSSQSKALELLWKGIGYADADSDPKKPDEGEGDGDPKPNIYVAKWMRKPGEWYPEDEDMPGKNSQSHEPTPAPEQARIDRRPAMPQSPTMRQVETVPSNKQGGSTDLPSAAFGRFHRLGK